MAKRIVNKAVLILLVFFFVLSADAAAPKYVFFFIGDGMGLAQVNSAEIYLNSLRGKIGYEEKLNMTMMQEKGFVTTNSLNSFITDSAAAGTALATGRKTNSGIISMDATRQHRFKTIAMMAKENKMKVGIVSSVSIDHATPACFYANEPNRSNYYEIALQLAESDFDYFAGGGFRGNSTEKGRDAEILLRLPPKRDIPCHAIRTSLEH